MNSISTKSIRMHRTWRIADMERKIVTSHVEAKQDLLDNTDEEE